MAASRELDAVRHVIPPSHEAELLWRSLIQFHSKPFTFTLYNFVFQYILHSEKIKITRNIWALDAFQSDNKFFWIQCRETWNNQIRVV